MFCNKCGHEVKEGTKFCEYCGAPVGLSQEIKKAANDVFNQTEQQLDSAINEVRETIMGNDKRPADSTDSAAADTADTASVHSSDKSDSPAPADTDKTGSESTAAAMKQQPADSNGGNNKMKLTDDRSLVSYIILSIITCGIYSYYFVYKLAHDINIACEGDDDSTAGLTAYILLSIITCGIYSLYWQYKIGNRLSANAAKYGLTFQENGTTILMWDIFGIILCFVGPYIAMYILIKNSNAIFNAYNREHGLV